MLLPTGPITRAECQLGPFPVGLRSAAARLLKRESPVLCLYKEHCSPLHAPCTTTTSRPPHHLSLDSLSGATSFSVWKKPPLAAPGSLASSLLLPGLHCSVCPFCSGVQESVCLHLDLPPKGPVLVLVGLMITSSS